MRDTVAIIGSHPGTRGEFDFNRTDCDIWVFNEAMSQAWATHADAVFQMHSPVIWRNPRNRNDPKHYDWLKSGSTPLIYMQEKYEEVPQAVAFPKDAMLGFIQHGWVVRNGVRRKVTSFTSSIAWAFALAVFLRYKRIEIYGIELESETEYFYQRGSFYYWAGVAEGLGIEVEYHCGMWDDPLYGYEGDVTLSLKVFEDRFNELQPKAQDLFNQYEMKRKEAAMVLKAFLDTGENPGLVVAAYGELVNTGAAFGELDGRLQEIRRYKEKAETMLKASGDFIFSRQEFETGQAGIEKQMNQQALRAAELTKSVEVNFTSLAKVKNKAKRLYIAKKSFFQLVDEYVKANVMASTLQGGLLQNRDFKLLLDKHIRAAGGAKSEEVILEAMGAEPQR